MSPNKGERKFKGADGKKQEMRAASEGAGNISHFFDPFIERADRGNHRIFIYDIEAQAREHLAFLFRLFQAGNKCTIPA